ncbi:hypothetical protein SAMN05421748_104311 [Paractinoplanes atraurantiacus]|uniref:Uncharacterized protein n=1 Tax=Paractinoplanes atraurantiacus TaxID=1036182 RepID=A0A285HFU7_9ACTN|nr:hypothetical protein SAMN05421748_104311 [Actinoplanes atraurantiacus]
MAVRCSEVALYGGFCVGFGGEWLIPYLCGVVFQPCIKRVRLVRLVMRAVV